MKIVSAREMIGFEKAAIESGAATAADLMQTAGAGMARLLGAHPGVYALVLCGKGNNGGDGLVLARLLAEMGWRVAVVLAAPQKELRGLPAEQLRRLTEEQPKVLIHPRLHESLFPRGDGIVIDALLGVGAEGPLRGGLAEMAAAVNAARAKRFFRTVALDVPTGLPGDPERAIVADLTITVGWAKDFLVREDFAARVGRIDAVPLFSDTLGEKDRLLTPATLAPLLPRRSALSHKNNYGRVVIVGGSPGFTGAPVLAARGALRVGAGLTNLAVDKAIYPIVAAQTPPEAMVLIRGADKKFAAVLELAKAVAIGPGLGIGAEARRALSFVLRNAAVPVVADADALTLLAASPSLFKLAKVPLILTPHPGEMRRLLGREFSPEERPAVARELSDARNAVVVLKGTRTIVAAPGEPLAYNSTGNPGLAVGGSGDTLTGIIAGLVAQGLSAANAARLGVWLHGRAADLALARRGCEEGLLPTDVSESVGGAIVSLRAA